MTKSRHARILIYQMSQVVSDFESPLYYHLPPPLPVYLNALSYPVIAASSKMPSSKPSLRTLSLQFSAAIDLFSRERKEELTELRSNFVRHPSSPKRSLTRRLSSISLGTRNLGNVRTRNPLSSKGK